MNIRRAKSEERGAKALLLHSLLAPRSSLLFLLTVFSTAIVLAQDDPCAILDQSGQTEAALQCYQRITAESQDPQIRANAFIKIAWLYHRLGDLGQALSAFRETLRLSRMTGDRTMEASTVNFIGLTLMFLGDDAAALDSYRHALSMAREMGDRKIEAQALYHIGWAHFRRQQFELALPYYRDALAAHRETADRKGEAIVLLGLGMVYSGLGQYSQGLQFQQEALPLAREIGDLRIEADALDHLGVTLTLLDRPEQAIEGHRRALAIRSKLGDRPQQVFSISSLARAQQALGRTREAAASMAEVVELIEISRRNLSLKQFRGSMFAVYRGHYARYLELLVELGDQTTAFSVSERARARLTLDFVQESLARAEQNEEASLFMREQFLLEEIERRERVRDTALPEKARAVGEQVDALRDELARVKGQLRTSYPKLAEARQAEALPAAQIQSELLDDRTAVIEYYLGPERSFVWVLTPSSITSYPLPAHAEIERVAVRLHALLSKGDQRALRHDLEVALKQLSSMILAPLEVPEGTQRLLIVPDGSLFYVPFAALSRNGRMLIDQYQITMAPSASALVLLRRLAQKRPSAEAGLAVFADPVFQSDDPRVRIRSARAISPDPDLVRSASETGLPDLRRLPATRNEANAIVRLVGGKNRKALDFEASRHTVMDEDLSRYRVAHFATHALVNAQHPELSGIVLSLVDERGAPVNGFLRLHDLYNLSGASDLVVLSACRTATGKELRGEGIVGLVSGFLHSGAPRVVASYWDVKDQATAELMKRFYRVMFAGGEPPASALRKAQRSMRDDDRWQAPYYWAAFALYGLP